MTCHGPGGCWHPLLALVAAAALGAQVPLIDPKTDVELDGVLATVNDAVILQSDVILISAGTIREREQDLGRPLTPVERAQVWRTGLEQKIDTHALAQASKTLGIVPPDRVEAVLEDQLRAEEREQVRELGTYQKLTEERARQSLNSTWQAIEREQRVNKLADLTRQMAMLRLQNQSNLFITPRMMRRFYHQHIDEFVHGSRARLGCIAFLGPDAAAVAAEAAKVWQQEELRPEDLMQRFKDRGATLPEDLLIDDRSRQRRRPDQVDFALAGPRGNVSAPVASGDSVRLWKVLEFAPSESLPFDDADVQRSIRLRMEHDVQLHLLQQTIKRSRQRTEVWYFGSGR